eukprot:PITA_14231
MQGTPQSTSQGSPLMDSSHSTSASCTNSGMRSVGKSSRVQASNDDEDSFTPVGEVCSGKRKPKWLQDTLREATSVAGTKRQEVVSRPEGKSIVTSRWLYKIKHAADGSIEKFKARFVARGFSQVEGVDYEETFAPIARYTSIRSIISIAAEMGRNIHQMDVKTAFLNGFIQEEV